MLAFSRARAQTARLFALSRQLLPLMKHHFLGIVLLAGCLGAAPLRAETGVLQTTLFDADPNHLWNRLYAALFLRTDVSQKVFYPDSGDLLFWTEMKHLRTEPSRGAAIRLLDEFVARPVESQPPAPLSRALLQSELWAAYDWAERKDEVLRARLGAAIGRLLLSRKEIDALPDNYAATAATKTFPDLPEAAHPKAPFLPADLLAPGGPWVCLGYDGERPMASQHVDGAEGRSAFLVFLRLPAGRAATLAYLEQILAVERLFLPERDLPKGLEKLEGKLNRPAKLNPDVPQIPPGTMVALVRRMVLIDDEKKLVVSHLTQSVALRVYREIAEDLSLPGARHAQEFHEFMLDRPALLAGRAPSLRTRGADEPAFGFGPQLAHYGIDPFDEPERIRPFIKGTQGCVMCHRLPGVFSVNSIANLVGLRSKPSRTLRETTVESEQEKARRIKLNFAPSELYQAR